MNSGHHEHSKKVSPNKQLHQKNYSPHSHFSGELSVMRQNNLSLSGYYRARTSEYERIYAKPERQDDLAKLIRLIPSLLAGKNLLEVACGTGYWTQYLAGTAERMVATDINPAMLRIAETKQVPPGSVDFRVANAFDLDDNLGTFNGAFVGFWWSHVPRDSIDGFLSALHRRLTSGAIVVMVDNLYVEGSSTPVTRKDVNGNSYQLRQLDDGTTHEVLKNFPEEAELRAALANVAQTVSYKCLDYYWLVYYETAA